MSKESIGQVCQKSATISNKLQSVTFNSVRKVLPDTVIEQACCDVGCRYRQRTITPVITVLHMLLAAIWPEESVGRAVAQKALKRRYTACRQAFRGSALL